MAKRRTRYEFGPGDRLKAGRGQWHLLHAVGLPGAPVYIRLGYAPDGRLVCTGLHIGDATGEIEVTATDLRQVPVAAILGDAAAFLTGEVEGLNPLGEAVMRQMAKAAFKSAVPFPGPRTRPGRQGLPAERIEWAAKAYRAALATAPRRPIQYLSEKSGVPEPTLRRWVQRARDRGLLGASTPGKAGEAARG